MVRGDILPEKEQDGVGFGSETIQEYEYNVDCQTLNRVTKYVGW